jgi:hypothetical protein
VSFELVADMPSIKVSGSWAISPFSVADTGVVIGFVSGDW